MEELIGRITGNVGIDAETARSAVAVILSFLHQEGDRESVETLVAQLPGADEYIDAGDEESGVGGGLGGLMGGGAMAVLGKLQGLGLGMGQIQGVTQETVGFAREKAGSETVDAIVASIPGLGQFV
jgi:hypothetical protein